MSVKMQKNWQWVRKAASQDEPYAQRFIGNAYCQGWPGIPQDSVEGLQWMEKAAENGHFMSQIEMGDYYLNKMDTINAIKFYTLAYQLSHEKPDYIWKFRYQLYLVQAVKNLAIFHYNGNGTPRDVKTAISYWHDATDWNDAESAYYVGTLYMEGTEIEQDIPLGFRYMRFAANNGYVDAQAYLGDCYMNGTGVEKDSLTAIQWYKQAAEAGHVGAMQELVWRYHDAENYDSTIYWGCQPECRDSALVQFYVGNAYYYKTDYDQAVQWWRKASDGGELAAYYNLGIVYYGQEYGMQNLPLAIGYWKLGAEQGSPKCQYQYGTILQDGFNLKKDRKQAIQWLKLAAENGNEQAQEELKKNK